MFHALFKSNKLIGIFDTKEAVDDMIQGLKENNFCQKNTLSIRKFKKNTICEIKKGIIVETDIENDMEINEENNINNEIKLSPEEEIEKIKKKGEIEYELTKLKKYKEKLEESKKTYTVDLELYQKFKKIKLDNNDFEIPDLFINKYDVFSMLDNENILNWENFYANYKHKNLVSSYGDLFQNSDAKSESLNI